MSKARRTSVRSEVTGLHKREVKDSNVKTKFGKAKNLGEHFAVVKAANGVTLTYGFQSVRVDVGVELPWEVDLDDAKGSLAKAFDAAYAIVDDELASRSTEIEPLLKSLAKRFGNR